MTSKKPVFFDATGRRAARFPPWDGRRRWSAPCWPSALSPAWWWRSRWPTVDFPGRTYSADAPRTGEKGGRARPAALGRPAGDRGPEPQAGSTAPAPAARQPAVAGAARHPLAAEGPLAGDRLLCQLGCIGRRQLRFAQALAAAAGLGDPQLADAGRAQPGFQDQDRPALAQLYARPQARRGHPAHAAECHPGQMGWAGPGQAAGRSGAPRKTG